jgi:hypothetical protein
MINLLIKYIKNPEYVNVPGTLNLTDFTEIIGKSVLIYFVFILLSTVLIILPISIFNLVPERVIMDLPVTFKIIILLPFYEELAFRLPLRYSENNLFIALGTIAFLFLPRSFSLPISLTIGLLIAGIPFLGILRKRFTKRIQIVYLKNYKVIFYSLAFIFGLLHLYNFKNFELIHFLISPLLVVNQIFMAFLLGFTRVTYKYGFLIAIMLHMLINFIFIVLLDFY